MKKSAKKKQQLSPLEDAVMKVVWSKGSATADDVRVALSGKHDLKDSTVRTILRRLAPIANGRDCVSKREIVRRIAHLRQLWIRFASLSRFLVAR